MTSRVGWAACALALALMLLGGLPAGASTTQLRDASGRLVEVHEQRGDTLMVRGPSGRLLRTERLLSDGRVEVRDASGRLIATRSPSGGGVDERDASGRLTGRYEARSDGGWQQRDASGRLVQSETPGANGPTRRDPSGRLIRQGGAGLVPQGQPSRR